MNEKNLKTLFWLDDLIPAHHSPSASLNIIKVWI